MSAPLQVRPFEPRDLAQAARLLAERQARDLQRLPMLSERLTRPTECAIGLDALRSNRRAAGFVAEDAGEVVGFLFGETQLHAPDSLAAQFIEPNSISISTASHAVAADADPGAVYCELYAVAATAWTRDGYFTHSVHLTPGDRPVEDAWVSLGFGRKTTCAARPVAQQVTGALAADLEVHLASVEDIDVVSHLEHTNMLHHVSAPIFWPLLPGPRRAIREFIMASLEDPENPHFVAYRAGQPVGMDTFLRHGFYPPTVDPDSSTYLLNGVIEPAARGGGIGKALLSHSMAWAREQGYRWCVLHFASANPSGGPFWLGQGFIPCEYTMVRRIDDRVAWARG